MSTRRAVLTGSVGRGSKGRWEVLIQVASDPMAMGKVDVFIYRQTRPGWYEMLVAIESEFNAGSSAKLVAFEEGALFPAATFSLGLEWAADILPALAGALDAIGVFPPDREPEELEGELAATRAHRDDLRKLLFTADLIREADDEAS